MAKNGKYSGYCNDLVEALSKRLGAFTAHVWIWRVLVA